MPDNVSLSIQDINDMKSQFVNAQNRLDVKNFVYYSDNKGKKKKGPMSLIGSDVSGIRIAVMKFPIQLKKGKKHIEFDFPELNMKVAPVFSVTLEATGDISDNQIFHNVTWNQSTKVGHVYFNCTKLATGTIKVTVNVTAIGYA